MYKQILTFVFIVAYCTVTESWMMHGIYHNDAHPGKCFVNEHLILSPGQEAKMPDNCAVIHCGNENGHADIEGCGSIAPPENCHWSGSIDVNAEFPLCCVQDFVCDNPADIPEAKRLQEMIRDMFQSQLENKENEH